MPEDFFKKGLERRKDVLGADYVERNLASADDFTRPFQEAMTAWCWGFGWADEAIDPKTRSMMNLAMIGALGKMTEWEDPLPRRVEKRRHQGGNSRHRACRRHLLRRAPGARMLPQRKEGAGGGRRALSRLNPSWRVQRIAPALPQWAGRPGRQSMPMAAL